MLNGNRKRKLVTRIKLTLRNIKIDGDCEIGIRPKKSSVVERTSKINDDA